MLISMLKYIKLHKSTPTCLDLNRSSSGLYLVKVTELFKKALNLKSWRSIPLFWQQYM